MTRFLFNIFIFLSISIQAQVLDFDTLENLEIRNIGPANMSGRITAIDVASSNPKIIYLGAASGGVWKSENGGSAWNSVFDQQNQFLKCRYGGLDFSADIKDNHFQEGDYWDCPKRATCAFNGIICKAPTYNGQKLSPIDIKLMKLLSTNATNEVIADALNLALGTFHKLKKALYVKLNNIQTKQELALIAKSLNLI